MLEQLRYVIEYQFLENKKLKLLQDYEETPRRIAAIEKEFSQAEGEYLSKKAEHENARKMHKDLEQGIADMEAKIGRSRKRMTDVKTNKEYQAIMREIDEYKKEIAAKEEKSLELMDVVETLAKQLESMESEVQKQRAILEENRSLLEAEGSKLKGRLDRLEAAQASVREKLEPAIQRQTEFLIKRQAGIAVAAVENGVCMVCHLNIPPQKYIELQRDESIMQCPHCRRYVYYPGHECYQFTAEDLEDF